MHSHLGWQGVGVGCCLCPNMLVSMAPVATCALFRKSLGLFMPPPAWAPAKELQALVYLLVHTNVCGFPAAVQPEVRHMGEHEHTHMPHTPHVVWVTM